MVPLALPSGCRRDGQSYCPPGVLHSSKPSNALGLPDTALPAHAPSLSLCGHQNEALKMVFLESVCTICRGDDNTGLCDRVALFCRENNLAEKVKVRGQ